MVTQPRNQKCPSCHETLNKLLAKDNSHNDRYLNHMLYCSHCQFLFYGIKFIKTFNDSNYLLLALNSTVRELDWKRCNNCNGVLYVIFYRKTSVDHNRKIRSKEYLYSIRHCQACKKMYFKPGIIGLTDSSLPADFQERISNQD